MNLLLVDSVDFPFGGAHSVHVTLFMKGLIENDENAFFIVPYGKKREALIETKNKYGHFDGVPYFFVRESKPIKKGFRFIDNFIAVIKTAALIRARRKKKNADAVIIGGIVDIIRDAPIIFTCSIYRIPLYFWLVERASLNEDHRGISGFLNHKSQQLSEWLFPKFASGLIVISNNLKKFYRKSLPENKILINPILVSNDSFKSINRQSFELVKQKLEAQYKGKRLLVYSGTFGEKDGLYCLVEAFAEVVKKYPDTIFVMTGKGYGEDLMDKIKNHISKYGVKDKVNMVGFVNADELLCYNTMANVLFVCRTNSPYANHGFPWKLGEYCMTAKPIIATRVTDIADYFVDNESLFIVEPNDPAAIVKKIEYIFENYEQALEVGQKSKAVAMQQFNYFEKSAEVVAFIKSTMK